MPTETTPPGEPPDMSAENSETENETPEAVDMTARQKAGMAESRAVAAEEVANGAERKAEEARAMADEALNGQGAGSVEEELRALRADVAALYAALGVETDSGELGVQIEEPTGIPAVGFGDPAKAWVPASFDASEGLTVEKLEALFQGGGVVTLDDRDG